MNPHFPLSSTLRSASIRSLSAMLQSLLFASVLTVSAAQAADGDPDTTFSGDGVSYVEWAGGGVNGARLGIAGDGKIVVGATLQHGTIGSDSSFAITRLRTDGALDTSFGFQGYRTVPFDYVAGGQDILRGVFPLPDGKLMLLGNAEVTSATRTQAPPAMVQLTANGNVDATFGVAGKISISASQSPWPGGGMYLRAVARQPDGKFLFGGFCLNCGGDDYSAVVLRVAANGTPDASFGQSGWARIVIPQTNALYSMVVDHQNRIVLAGNSLGNGVYRPTVVRFTSTGLPDSTFGGGDAVELITLIDSATVNWRATDIAVDGDDALLLSVSNQLSLAVYRTGVIRLLPDGSLHLNYGVDGLRELTRDSGSEVQALALRSDRRLVAAGWIENSGSFYFYAARTLPNGSLDNAFDGNGVARYTLPNSQYDIAQAIVLAAGKPVIAGVTTAIGSNSHDGISILRLQSDLIFTDGVD